MRKLVISFVIILFLSGGFLAHGQVQGFQNNWTPLSGYYPSAVGAYNTVNGKYSFVGGTNSKANGEVSFSFGSYASVLETGIGAMAFGTYVESSGPFSMTLGRYLKSTSSSAIVIGSGRGTNEYFKNQIANSLMVGFLSQYPTLFVSPSSGSTLTGKIGIGNITSPTVKVHILSDEDEAAELKLEPRTTGLRQYAKLYLSNHTIRAGEKENMVFTTPEGRNFCFENGNLGVGTETPRQTLHVNGNILLSSTYSTLLFGDEEPSASNSNPYWGKWGIEYFSGGLNFWLPYQWKNISDNNVNPRTGDDFNFKLFLRDDGNVGIGTGTPRQTLHVNGNILLSSKSSTLLFGDEEPTASNSIPFWGKWGIEYYAGGLNFWLPYQWNDINDMNVNPRTGDDFNFKLFLSDNGNVGVGTGTPLAKLHVNGNSYFQGKMIIGEFGNAQSISKSNHMLFVQGGITTEEVFVKLESSWPDYVFNTDYNLITLKELKEFVAKFGHLPGLPTANEVKDNGVELAKLNAKLLEKIEELTLYIIQQEDRIKKLENEIDISGNEKNEK
jgi:hypothetical protein